MSQEWTKCEVWKDIPVGTWIVKIKKDRKPYHIATVTKNDSGEVMIIAGSCFHWDLGPLLAYSKFDPYEPED
jgi:hypothetical protein